MNERLKMIRKAKHMTQTELAEILNIKQTAISAIESGRASLTARNKQMLYEKLYVSPIMRVNPHVIPVHYTTRHDVRNQIPHIAATTGSRIEHYFIIVVHKNTIILLLFQRIKNPPHICPCQEIPQ